MDDIDILATLGSISFSDYIAFALIIFLPLLFYRISIIGKSLNPRQRIIRLVLYLIGGILFSYFILLVGLDLCYERKECQTHYLMVVGLILGLALLYLIFRSTRQHSRIKES